MTKTFIFRLPSNFVYFPAPVLVTEAGDLQEAFHSTGKTGKWWKVILEIFEQIYFIVQKLTTSYYIYR